jgi:citrate synthase
MGTGQFGYLIAAVVEIADAQRAESVLSEKLERGERLMGFGHRIYKVRDPRAEVLSSAAARMFQAGEDMAFYNLARSVEESAVRLLEEYKPGRNLQTNVEFYTALLLQGLGLETELFTPTFAIGRASGWIAHCFEQQEAGRLIRPQSVYHGEKGRQWKAESQRA